MSYKDGKSKIGFKSIGDGVLRINIPDKKAELITGQGDDEHQNQYTVDEEDIHQSKGPLSEYRDDKKRVGIEEMKKDMLKMIDAIEKNEMHIKQLNWKVNKLKKNCEKNEWFLDQLEDEFKKIDKL